MTITEIESNLDDIMASIVANRRILKQAIVNIPNAANTLGNIPTVYATTLSAINALGTGTHETALKARRAAYAAEFTALRDEANAAVAALEGITFEG